MQYQTIMLSLLEESPTLHHSLCVSRSLLPTLEHTARTLKDRHAYWISALSQEQPERTPEQIASQALEIAVQEMRDALPAESSPSDSLPEPLSLDAAMNFLRQHTPPA